MEGNNFNYYRHIYDICKHVYYKYLYIKYPLKKEKKHLM